MVAQNEKGTVLHSSSVVEQGLGAESLIFFFNCSLHCSSVICQGLHLYRRYGKTVFPSLSSPCHYPGFLWCGCSIVVLLRWASEHALCNSGSSGLARALGGWIAAPFAYSEPRVKSWMAPGSPSRLWTSTQFWKGWGMPPSGVIYSTNPWPPPLVALECSFHQSLPLVWVKRLSMFESRLGKLGKPCVCVCVCVCVYVCPCACVSGLVNEWRRYQKGSEILKYR